MSAGASGRVVGVSNFSRVERRETVAGTASREAGGGMSGRRTPRGERGRISTLRRELSSPRRTFDARSAKRVPRRHVVRARIENREILRDSLSIYHL